MNSATAIRRAAFVTAVVVSALAGAPAAGAALTSGVFGDVLSITSSAGDSIVVTCDATTLVPSVKINGFPPDTGTAACSAVKSIDIDGGPLANTIDLSGVGSAFGIVDPAWGFFPLAVQVDGGGDADPITGSAFSDYLDGGAGSDTIAGGPGDDVLLGAQAGDNLNGGVGENDSHVVMLGSIGSGTVSVADGGAAPPSSCFSCRDFLQVVGTPGDDTGASKIVVTDMQATRGSETVSIGAGIEVRQFYGELGSDTVDASATTERVELFADAFFGTSGDDALIGGSGNDVLVSFAGTDNLSGGAGSDGYEVWLESIAIVTVSDPDAVSVDFLGVNATNLPDTIGVSPTQITLGTKAIAYSGIDVGSISGMDGGDTFNVAGTGAAFTLNGGGDGDVYSLNAWGALAQPLMWSDDGTSGTDSGTVPCGANVSISGNTATRLGESVTWSGLETPPACSTVTEDVTKPTLNSWSISPTAVDVTAGSANFTVTANLTDNLSGVAEGADCSFKPCPQVQFTSPSGQTMWVPLTRVGTTDVFTGTGTIPQAADSGKWKPTWFTASDKVGNVLSLSNADLVGLGFNVELDVTSVPDTTKLSLNAFSFSPTTIDVTGADATFTVTANLTDVGTGVASGSDCAFKPCPQVQFQSPGGEQNLFVLLSPSAPGSSVFTGTVTVPRYSQAGSWTANWFLASDKVGNILSLSTAQITALGFATALTVTDTNEDVVDPALNSITVSPTSIDVTTGSATINTTVDITDSLSGLATGSDCGFKTCAQLLFVSPTAMQSAFAIFSPTAPGSSVWTATTTIPQFSEAGIWTAQFFMASDKVGNVLILSPAELLAAGFDPKFGVKKHVTGTVAPGGTLSSDPEGDGATTNEPVEASVTSPTGGSVTIEESFVTTPSISGWSFLGNQINITAPAGTASSPLTIVFTIDASKIPAGGINAISVAKNGTPVSNCTQTTPSISPDPCIAGRTLLANGDAEITVKSSTASAWNLIVKENAAPSCETLAVTPTSLWPPNHNLVTVTVGGATDADGDTLTYSIEGVTQDEPVDGFDAVLVPGQPNKVQLRAERAGNGDGRIYRIEVEVSDGIDTCTKTVKVAVPHDRAKPSSDSGGSYGSLG